VQGATIIRNRTNEGFPRACNTGAARKQSPLIFFLNSDVILEPNAIKIAVTALDDDKIGVVGMKLLFPTEEQLADAKMNPNIRPARKIQHIGLYCNVHGEFLHTMIGWSEDNPRTFAIRDAYVVTGAALMTRRSIWNKVGGFNLAYGMGTYEDVDYCLSVRDLGYNIIVEQAAMGTHYTGATSEQHKIQFPLQYNRLVFLQRWAAKLNYTEHLAW
jgi:GT2 family glycosyltransferase